MSELIGDRITLSVNGVETIHRVRSLSFDPTAWSANGQPARMNVKIEFQGGGSITVPKAKYDEMVNND